MNNHIKSFNQYKNESKTLYVFDFDDTLVNTPSFEEVVKKLIVEKVTAKDLLIRSVNLIGKKITDLKWRDGRIYIDDPSQSIEIKGNWIRKGLRVYLVSPDEFSFLDDSMPKEKTKFSELYNKVENKCIVTARPELVRSKIETVLSQMGFEYPKWGLHMLPKNRRGAGEWKGEKIVEISSLMGAKKIVFFDDNSKYLKKAGKVVKEKLPNVIWEPHKIIN
jgi:hypothetical protein